jgi:hypothetical protein
LTEAVPHLLAHGVGSVYESPIPVAAYLGGAAGAVLASFGVQIFSTARPQAAQERKIAGETVARSITGALRVAGVVGLVLTLASGAIAGDESPLAALLFWVGLVVGVAFLSAVLAGAWAAADPWATLEDVYRVEDKGPRSFEPPWWLGPALLYALFWFELVSGAGFEASGIVFVLIVYSVFSFGFRSAFADAWGTTDPLSILFGFAERIAPLELKRDGIYARNPLTRLDQPQPLAPALTVSVFVLLASTTLDNVRETVGWTSLLRELGLDEASAMIVDSVALIAFAVLFAAPFIGAIAIARIWLGRTQPLLDTVRHFGWSLIPIGIAYLLAHNAPLVISGIPQIIRSLADPFALGWNLLGLGDAFEQYAPSPRLVWFVEIGLIVGGHILAVLTAHRTALRLTDAADRAVPSQFPLMALMTIYTVATLWLLAQPLVI